MSIFKRFFKGVNEPTIEPKAMSVQGHPVTVSTNKNSRPKLQRHKKRAMRLKISIKKMEVKGLSDTSPYHTLIDELEQHELHIKQHKQNVRRSE